MYSTVDSSGNGSNQGGKHVTRAFPGIWRMTRSGRSGFDREVEEILNKV